MSDFVFSRNTLEKGKITEEIQSIYHDEKQIVKEFHGHWGSFGISKNLYNGFDPYENDQYIVTVIGGPVLEFRENNFLNDEYSSEGTKAIFKRWQLNEMIWDVDLSGPFVVLIINKQTSEITCITDLMSFIPVYSTVKSKNIVLSTHVDVLARVTEQSEYLDEVSILDFILHGVVTYPHTIYKSTFQIAPASKHILFKRSSELQSTAYWIPIEKNNYNSIKEAASDLRNSLQNYVDKITSQTTKYAQFISAGEDSRVLSALLQDKERDAYIFLDQMNREGIIARKVASTYGANFKLSTRSKLHYLSILPNCSDLVGSGSQYHHAHTYGFHEICKLNTYSAVFGGLLADALLKGSHIKRIKISTKFPFLPDIKKSSYTVKIPLTNSILENSLLSELTNRRRSHLIYVKSFRDESAEEWFELWPSSMNSNIPNIHANRRLFRSYEPFTSRDVVKISATIPQKWKLNRRLFHETAKTFLKPSRYLFHGDGRLPYYPWYANFFIQLPIWIYRQIARKTGLIKGNQGPWGDWNAVINSPKWKQTFVNFTKSVPESSSVLRRYTIQQLIDNNKLSSHQYINLTQTLYQLGRIHQG